MTRKYRTPLMCLFGLAVTLLAVAGCAGGDDESLLEPEQVTMSIELISPAFAEGSTIPTRYTCDGDDVSPALNWSGVPEGTKSIALIADDPDAPRGTWVHWVLYGVPPDVGELPEAMTSSPVTPTGARNGKNDFGKSGYGGPCPPRGAPHRYFFKLYALDGDVDLESGAKKEELLRAMEGPILAGGQLMGTYQRR